MADFRDLQAPWGTDEEDVDEEMSDGGVTVPTTDDDEDEESLIEVTEEEFLNEMRMDEEALSEEQTDEETPANAEGEQRPSEPFTEAEIRHYFGHSSDEEEEPTMHERIRQEIPEEYWPRADELAAGDWDPIAEWQYFRERSGIYASLYEPEYGEWLNWEMLGRENGIGDLWAMPSASRYDNRMEALMNRSEGFPPQIMDRIPILERALETLGEIQQRTRTVFRQGIPPGTNEEEDMWRDRTYDIERTLHGRARRLSREVRAPSHYLDWCLRLLVAIDDLFAFIEEEGPDDAPSEQTPIRRRRIL